MIQQFMRNNLKIIPSYAPTLLYLKLSKENIIEAKIMDFISAGYIALRDFIEGYKINSLLLSLADLTSHKKTFYKLSRDLFLWAKIYDIQLILDSGCLEYYMIPKNCTSYIGLSSKINDPHTNLKAQLKFSPDVIILPDRPSNMEENIKILYMYEIKHLLIEAKRKDIKLAYVIHGIYPLDRIYSNLMKITKAPLLSYIDYVCIPEKELNMYKNDEIMEPISLIHSNLSKEIAVLGIAFLNKNRLSIYRKQNIRWCDTIKWNYKVLRLLKGSIICDNIQSLIFSDLVSILKSNLDIMNELVNNIGRTSNNY